jgi:hypothetical protein
MADPRHKPRGTDRPPTIAERRFAEQAAELTQLALPDRFARIHETNLWSDPESRSGSGSALASTTQLRAELPGLLHALGVSRLLDVPCGDFHWMSHVDFAEAGVKAYVGGDVVQAIVEANRARYALQGREFQRVDLTTGPLPLVDGAPADAVFCRDCLVHLSFANIARVFDVLKASGARYLLTTTFLEQQENLDVADGDWRALNLQRSPFNLPIPLAVIVERCDEEGGAYADKALAAWRVADLP